VLPGTTPRPALCFPTTWTLLWGVKARGQTEETGRYRVRRGPRRACGSTRRVVDRVGGRRRRIVISSMCPAGDVSGSNLTFEAYVVDRRSSLTSIGIDLYLDGRVMRFDYRPSSGTLRCSTGSLSKGIHTVEQEEVDFQHQEIVPGSRPPARRRRSAQTGPPPQHFNRTGSPRANRPPPHLRRVGRVRRSPSCRAPPRRPRLAHPVGDDTHHPFGEAHSRALPSYI
jgi:hypothetical protein